MDDMPNFGRGEDNRLLKQFLAQYGVPAYVRRACRVQEAFEELLSRCRRQRDDWLIVVRMRFAVLPQGQTGEASALLHPWLAEPDQAHIMQQLQQLLDVEARPHNGSPPSTPALRRALHELTESIERFNRRWQTFLEEVDLGPLNELRDNYNRYYLLEKECALRSARIARQGFQRLEPLTREELAGLLPLLPVPSLER